MKLIPVIFLAACFFSCEQKPFVEHNLIFKKISNGCTDLSPSFKLNSNFGGERYEFTRCLSQEFEDGHLTTMRKGDTVAVIFEDANPEAPKATFAITLDIDSYPTYHYITIGDDTYSIVPSKK